MMGFRCCVAAIVSLFVAGAVDPAHAQGGYPSKPVRLIVGFGPGSAADITGRALSGRLSQILGQQVVVESRPGAGSNLAAEYVARSPKDGYTLFLGAAPNVANAAINPNLSYNLITDFTPLALTNTAAVVLVVHPSIAAKNVAELAALAKSKPGELAYASTGIGAAPHLSGELFSQRIGAKMVHVPYPGSAQAMPDLLAGRVHLMFSPATAVVPQIAAGTLRALASATSKRAGILPDLPTMEEAGMPDFDTSIWFGVLAPAGTPKDVTDKLTAAVQEAAQSSDVIATWRPQGIDPLSGGPEQFARHIVNEAKRWGDVAAAAGLKK